MLTQHIAIVPEADGVNASELARVSAALQKQVARDLGPLWDIRATVDPFPRLEDVPVGYWPIIVSFSELGRDAGIHLDRTGQPFAQIELSASWSLPASRACLDMLINPYGTRTASAASPRGDQGPVEYLVEVCAPCEDAEYAYLVNDVLVSDFCAPTFFSTRAVQHADRYSFSGAVQTPFQVLPGGHVTWHEAVSDCWWMRSVSSESAMDTRLGAADRKALTVRELARARAPLHLQSGTLSLEAFEARTGLARQHALQASQFRAHRLRAELGGKAHQQDVLADAQSRISAARLRTSFSLSSDRQLELLVEALHEEAAAEELTHDSNLEEIVIEQPEAVAEPEVSAAPEDAEESAFDLELTPAFAPVVPRTVPPPLPVTNSIRPVNWVSTAPRAFSQMQTKAQLHTPAKSEPRHSVKPAVPSSVRPQSSTRSEAPRSNPPSAAPASEWPRASKRASKPIGRHDLAMTVGALAAAAVIGMGLMTRSQTSAGAARSSSPQAPLPPTAASAECAQAQVTPAPAAATAAPAAAAAQPRITDPLTAATALSAAGAPVSALSPTVIAPAAPSAATLVAVNQPARRARHHALELAAVPPARSADASNAARHAPVLTNVAAHTASIDDSIDSLIDARR